MTAVWCPAATRAHGLGQLNVPRSEAETCQHVSIHMAVGVLEPPSTAAVGPMLPFPLVRLLLVSVPAGFAAPVCLHMQHV
jgi:hypothetical protein